LADRWRAKRSSAAIIKLASLASHSKLTDAEDLDIGLLPRLASRLSIPPEAFQQKDNLDRSIDTVGTN
jgi:hypothetical protein